MITIEKTNIFGWEATIRGMRNPMNSWEKSDSGSCTGDKCFYTGECWNSYYQKKIDECPLRVFDETGNSPMMKMEGGFNTYIIGENDMNLMKRLRNAGTDHRKYLRMIHVQADIIAPLYWWKEYDTYKVSTVANSCSTMHKIHVKEFELSDFSIEHLNDDVIKKPFKQIIDCLNFFRELYLQNKDKDDWWQMIQLLPTSYNQKRTVDLNYENLINMYHARKNHKLDEWREFCEWIETLPYSELIIGDKKEGE